MRIALASVCCGLLALFSFGCTIEGRGGVVVESPSVEVDPPVIDVDIPALVVDVEPPIEQRVYVYDEGFPPGVYLYGGFYYYGGHRYEHDVFVTRYVQENIRRHKFVNVEENRRVGHEREVKHREEFARTKGVRHPAEHKAVEHKEGEHKAVEHKEVEHKAVEHHETPTGRPPEKAVEHGNAPAEHHGEKPALEHPQKPVEHHEAVKPEGRPPEKAVRPSPAEEKKREEEKKNQRSRRT